MLLRFLNFDFQRSHLFVFLSGLFFVPFLKWFLSGVLKLWNRKKFKEDDTRTLYSLAHGKLNLTLSPPSMWMNMGYWKEDSDGSKKGKACSMTLAQASRNLLSEVLKTAGFDRARSSQPPQKKTLIDLGVGCGEQTVYLNSQSPIRESDITWWDDQKYVERFDTYIGITVDKTQFRYAEQRLQECIQQTKGDPLSEKRQLRLFCADAAQPDRWNLDLQQQVLNATKDGDENWVMALDTLYHFAPSRWPVIEYASRVLGASFMAFDLCLADEASGIDRALLRALTSLMRAPWANFSTMDEYRSKLHKAGYSDVKLRDVTERVFGPLVTFLGDHDQKLQSFGSGLGQFHVAKWMFGWWARSGIMRGVIVVARR
ncbi:hypothetical protein BU24DRAFT_416328 [Aaosphaeria arxii CBS 175.79]|uniref:S-adenosyl-L-methionine-dependent methyltransferase n=1 Tax=Aaosphaeria arxii CBS 175.79 TaxID=1450172 RepID=A0A6A5Y772_9PLEO|nr:uncharacterized protein BU24DRAFT_416328 [Aaosphaeria arxii CBS 175.79]KAF2020650.1 hypothetical protein BU24DRAFT_416328 [Aaosphaeria arxii CBS 175.79]